MESQSARGNYDVIALMANSPSTILYRAKAHSAEHEKVVIKVWKVAGSLTSTQQELIRQEIEALIRLQHPHILTPIAFTLDATEITLISAYIPGGSLQLPLIRNFLKPFSLDEALSIIRQVGRALYAAHRQQIFHGSLTPYNVLFMAQQTLVLTDFRLKHIMAAIENNSEESVPPPRCWYMAPEQFKGVINAQSDQYALGCLAYQLLTGRVPFTGSEQSSIQQKHLTETPAPLIEANPTLPSHIEQAILKALAKDPVERHTDVQAFLDALEEPGQYSAIDQEVALANTATLTAYNNISPSQESLPQTGFSLSSTLGQPELLSRSQHPGRSQSNMRRVLIAVLSVILFVGILGTLLALSPLPTTKLTQGPGTPTQAIAQLQATNQPQTTSSPIAAGLTPALTPSVTPLLVPVSPTPLSTRPGATPSPTLAATQPGATPSPTLASTQQAVTHPSPTPPPAQTAVVHPTPTPSPAPPAVVKPQLTCVINNGNGSFTARFGYVNSGSTTMTIPQGPRNVLIPFSYNGVQPTTFLPGQQSFVFQVSSSGNQLAWVLNGSMAIASSTSLPCS